MGLLSTVIWAWAQVPQVVLNFKTSSVVGVSSGFVILIVVGDLSNLIGIIIEHGLATQIITAAWFLLLDSVCWFQIIWYHTIKPCCCPSPGALPAIPLLIGMAASASENPYKPPLLWGTLLGWLSAVCYLGSRFPQLCENYRRKATEGLSPNYFLSAIFGNITYALSIFLEDASWPYIWKQFPWLAGSLGNLFFDFIMISQFVKYRVREVEGDGEMEKSGTDGVLFESSLFPPDAR
jgi:uncharacterized protein with PQ loop repeat